MEAIWKTIPTDIQVHMHVCTSKKTPNMHIHTKKGPKHTQPEYTHTDTRRQTHTHKHTPWGKVAHSTTPPATTPKRAMPKIWLGKRMLL